MAEAEAHTQTGGDLAASVKSAGSSFYRAMTLLAPARRQAMFALYAFCRAVDDIADDDGRTSAQRQTELAAWRERIEALYAEAHGKTAGPGTEDPLCRELIKGIKTYHPRQEDFIAIIDGMVMDSEAIVAPDLDTLDLYCDRVASAVGRVSVHIFGDSSQTAYQVSHHLGRALQLTNILRDLAEDAARGRLYLPYEILEANQIADSRTGIDPKAVLRHPHLEFACANLALLAEDHYEQAFACMRGCLPGSMRAARLMGRAYEAVLARLRRSRWRTPEDRISLPRWEKLWILARYGFLQ